METISEVLISDTFFFYLQRFAFLRIGQVAVPVLEMQNKTAPVARCPATQSTQVKP